MPNKISYATKMLRQLKELDYQTVEAYYDMGSIISSMQHGKLYEVLDYESMSELINEELTFSSGTGHNYAHMYRGFRRLHYTKVESIDLLKEFGLTHMRKVLGDIKTKIGKRAIKTRIDAIDERQINFTVNGKELKKVHKALFKLGAEQNASNHRFQNSSPAFMAMVDQINAAPLTPFKLVKSA